MKYREGDLVRIKSFEWWNEQPKNEYGAVVKMFRTQLNVFFYRYEANRYCSKIGKITNIDKYSQVEVVFDDDMTIDSHEDWIEGEVEKLNIHLKLMKGEI